MVLPRQILKVNEGHLIYTAENNTKLLLYQVILL